MNEYPIVFTAKNALKVRLGTKTQTRRVIPETWELDIADWEIVCNNGQWSVLALDPLGGYIAEFRSRYGGPGNTLWMREPIYHGHWSKDGLVRDGTYYRADDEPVIVDGRRILPWRWKVSGLAGRYMPREACRTRLQITALRVERLQGISVEDAIAEGCDSPLDYPRNQFQALWQSVSGKSHPWTDNDWVMAYTFRRSDG